MTTQSIWAMKKMVVNLFKSSPAMKRSFVFVFLAAAIAFAACNRVETENLPNEEDFYYTFAINDPETKSILGSDENGKFGKWENGDRLGTAIDIANPGYAYVTIGTPSTFRIYKKGGLSGGEKVYAYYPYNSAATSVSEIPFEIPTGQNQNGEIFDFDAMPMVAEEFVVPTSYASANDNTEVGEISLINLGSVIDFQVYSSNETYAAETILSVKFEAATPVAGSFNKNITTVKFDTESTLAISGFTEKEVLTTVANAPSIGANRANAAHVYMVVAPTSGVTGSVIVKTNKAEYTYSLSTAQTFKRAGLKSFGLNLGTCQNRVSDETNTTTFVFNTTAGIQSLGLELPEVSAGTTVDRVVSDCIVLTGDIAEGSTAPRVYNSNGTFNFRVNKNNSITLSVSEGTIKGVSFAAGDNFNLTVTEGTLTGTNWEGAVSSITFTNTDAGRTDINTITVSYTGGVAPVDPVALVMSDIACDDDGENENSLTFSWSAVENASGYQVSTDGGNTYGEVKNELSYTWTDLLAGTEYTIYVKAVGDGTNFITSEAKTQKGTTKEGETTGVQWVETALGNLSSTDVVVIVGDNFALTNNNGTGSAPATVAVTVSGNKLVGDIAENIRWNVSVSDGNCTIYPNGVTNKWLYCNTTAQSSSNNCIRVGTGDRKVFILNSANQLETNDTYTKRYLSIYNEADWRGYINTNLAPAIKFYKKVGNEPAPTTYSVTISEIQNGTVITSKTSGITAGESITLTASPTDAANWEFDSWSITGIALNEAQKTTNPLTIQMPASDIVVSASFKEKEHSGDEQTAVFVFNTDAGLSALGISKPETGKGTNLGDNIYTVNNVSLTATDGGTATRVWNSQGTTDLRIYKSGGSLTFSVDNAKSITSIVISGGTTNKFTANVGAFSNGTWEGSASSVTLTATDTGKIDTITVTYE